MFYKLLLIRKIKEDITFTVILNISFLKCIRTFTLLKNSLNYKRQNCDKGRLLNNEWIGDYFFIKANKKTICVICIRLLICIRCENCLKCRIKKKRCTQKYETKLKSTKFAWRQTGEGKILSSQQTQLLFIKWPDVPILDVPTTSTLFLNDPEFKETPKLPRSSTKRINKLRLFKRNQKKKKQIPQPHWQFFFKSLFVERHKAENYEYKSAKFKKNLCFYLYILRKNEQQI